MSIKDIKTGRWQRQWHLANAGARAGVGWASGQWRTMTLPDEARDIAREHILREQAMAWVAEMGQLKGSVVKIGQILATYADYCLPPAIAEALHTLEADTAPLAWSHIHAVLRHQLPERLSELIVEPSPLAAASLAQVHRARVKSDGRAICLKILYPGIQQTLDTDLGLVAVTLRWLLPADEREQLATWLAAIGDILRDELNLPAEQHKLEHWHKRLAHDARYVIPQTEERWSGSQVLAMSFEAGVAVHDPLVMMLSQERRNRLAQAMLELFLREVLLWGEMQTDPHAGNYRIRIAADDADTLVLLDFGSVRLIAQHLLTPLRHMIIAAYRDDAAEVIKAAHAAGLLAEDAPTAAQNSFACVLLGLIEPLNYRHRLRRDPASVPGFAVDAAGNYLWANAQLPKRMGKQALQSAASRHFVFPGADFLLLSRKLAGVYAFIAALDARFDAADSVEKILSEQ
jgi:predicted unusual protein kinase regulating ubiquinone biosynthesis (AarF/ABC1/UbiB family)